MDTTYYNLNYSILQKKKKGNMSCGQSSNNRSLFNHRCCIELVVPAGMIPIRMLSGRALNFSGKVPSTRSIPTFPCDFSNNPLTTSCTIPSPPTQTTLKIKLSAVIVSYH